MKREDNFQYYKYKKLTKLKIQLKWIPQAQFEGILAAIDMGFFEEEGIEVELMSGGPGIDVEQKVANKEVDLGISSFSNLLVYRERKIPIVSIAQIMQGFSMGLITRKSSGIDIPEKMIGKRIGTFGGSNQNQLLAFIRKYKIAPPNGSSLILQNTINDFLNGFLDVGSITVYNEFQSVLEGGLNKRDLNIFMFKYNGVNMLEDTIVARKDWIIENHALAVKALRAIIKGWKFATIYQDRTIDAVMKYTENTTSSRKHQENMLREFLKLMTPKCFPLVPCYYGVFDKRSLYETGQKAYMYNIINNPADIERAYDLSVAREAVYRI